MSRISRHGAMSAVIGAATLGLMAIAASAVVTSAQAGSTAMRPASSVDQAAAQGLQIFNHDRFGGVRTCSACHINGGTTLGKLPNGAKIPSLMGVAAQFPKYKSRAHRVVTLEQQLVHCIKGGLRGTPPAAGSPQMTDLIAYLTKLSKGSTMGQQFK